MAVLMSYVSVAHAADVNAAPASLSPQARAFLAQRAQRLGLTPVTRQADAKAGYVKVDIESPALTGLKAARSEVDASKPGAQLAVDFSASDDYSGVVQVSVGFQMVGDYGYQYLTYVLGYPDTTAGGRVALDAYGLKPGTWRVNTINLSDIQGNSRNLYADYGDFDAFGGAPIFHVTGGAGDLQAPTLVKGKVLTHRVALSKPQKGTLYGTPLAGAEITVNDTAESRLSGVRTVSASFCSPQNYECLVLNSSEIARGESRQTLRAYAQVLFYSFNPGDYKLTALTLTDFAGNSRTLTSIEDGGDTDFSQYFDSTTITVLP